MTRYHFTINQLFLISFFLNIPPIRPNILFSNSQKKANFPQIQPQAKRTTWYKGKIMRILSVQRNHAGDCSVRPIKLKNARFRYNIEKPVQAKTIKIMRTSHPFLTFQRCFSFSIIKVIRRGSQDVPV